MSEKLQPSMPRRLAPCSEHLQDRIDEASCQRSTFQPEPGRLSSGSASNERSDRKRFFEFLSHDERIDCLCLGDLVKYPRCTVLARRGEPSAALRVLLDGEAEVRLADYSSEQVGNRRGIWRSIVYFRDKDVCRRNCYHRFVGP